MDLGLPHPPYPPPPYTSRPTTPDRGVDGFHDYTPGLSSSAAPKNTGPNNVAENEDSIPGHILAESRELAELHRRALELAIEHGGAGNDFGSQYPDFEDPDGHAIHGDASSEYEDFVEPDGQVLPSAQASIHDGGNAGDDASVASRGASTGPATGVVNASAAPQATQRVIRHFMLPFIQPAPGQNAIYATPYAVGEYPVPTIHQLCLDNPASVLANASGGGTNQGPNNAVPAQANVAQPANNPSAPIAPSNTTANTLNPQNAPNLADNTSASAGNPHAEEEYADWAEPPGPPPRTNNNAGNAGASSQRSTSVSFSH